jgi:hypothetical protein
MKLFQYDKKVWDNGETDRTMLECIGVEFKYPCMSEDK